MVGWQYVTEDLQATIWGLEHRDPSSPYEHGDLAVARWITRAHECADNALQVLARKPNNSHDLCAGFDRLRPGHQKFLRLAFCAAHRFFDIEATSQLKEIRRYLSTAGNRRVYFKMRHFAYYQAVGTDEDRQQARKYLKQVNLTLHLELLYAFEELVDPVFPTGNPRPMTVIERVNNHVWDAFLDGMAHNPDDEKKVHEFNALIKWIGDHTDPIATILDDPPTEEIHGRTISACSYLEHDILEHDALRYLLSKLRKRYTWK